MVKKNLVQLIRDNPGCLVKLDISSWVLYKQDPYNNPFRPDDEDAPMDRKAADHWDHENKLAEDGEIEPLKGIGGYNWGGDIFQALAQIVGIEIDFL